MATRNPEQITLAGLEPTYHAASAGGDRFAPASDVVLHVVNGSGAAVDVTVVTTSSVIGQPVTDVVVTVPAGESRFVGPFPRQHFAAGDGLADITWESTGSVTFAALRT